MCINICDHFDITDDIISLALEEEKKLAWQKGIKNPTTLNLNSRHDFIGSIAQNGVFALVESWGIALDSKFPYFDPQRHNDDYDYIHRGVRFDVQGTALDGVFRDGTPIRQVYPRSLSFVKREKESKNMQAFTFCFIDFDSRVLHVAGNISAHEVWEMPVFEDMKHPCRKVPSGSLTSFRDFIFGSNRG